MRIAPLLSALALMPVAALAEPDGAGWPEGRLVAALTGDWMGSGAAQLVLLVEGQDAADLILYTRTERDLVPALTVPGVAFLGPMWGQQPDLHSRSETSFVIHSEQSAVGRTPWQQQVTIAWRDGDWVVAGYTTQFYDRLDMDHGGHCDANLLSGGWEGWHAPGEGAARRTAAGHDGPRAFPLAELTEDWQPAVCASLFGG